MSAALPIADPCCIASCDGVVVQNIPGAPGGGGTPGLNGTNGISAITTIIEATPPNGGFTMPAELASSTIWVVSTAGFVIGENVFVQGLGTLQVTAILTATTATLKNLENAATSAYASNAAPGAVAAIGSRVGTTGLQGQAGALALAADGINLKGTYPNLLLSIPNALGALAVGNGTDANSLSAGTNGQIPAYDSSQTLGLIPKSIIPITGGTDVAADRLVRLSSATGLPIPLESSKASLKDPGGLGLLVADASTGNPRGTDAVDLQVSRNVVGGSAVASGSQSVIVGGQDNTAFGLRSAVVGGENNLASGSESFIGGGDSNTVDSTQSTIAGGDTNGITGGSANESFIGGGRLNAITGNGQATIAGGISNSVSAQYGTVGGGSSNVVAGLFGVIPGGNQASADKYGQRAFASGMFAVAGDCQQSDLLWRIATTTDTANVEAFLDGASLRAVVPTGKTWAFDILCMGRSSAGVSAAWTVKGAIQNIAGVVALVGAGVTAALLGDGSVGTWGAVGNAPLVDADDPNNALRIRVTGALTTNIRWTMHARILEVAY